LWAGWSLQWWMSRTHWDDLAPELRERLEAGAETNRALRSQRARERRARFRELGPVSGWVTLSRVPTVTRDRLYRIARLKYALEVVAGRDPSKWSIRQVLDDLAREELDRLEERVGEMAEEHPELMRIAEDV